MSSHKIVENMPRRLKLGAQTPTIWGTASCKRESWWAQKQQIEHEAHERVFKFQWKYCKRQHRMTAEGRNLSVQHAAFKCGEACCCWAMAMGCDKTYCSLLTRAHQKVNSKRNDLGSMSERSCRHCLARCRQVFPCLITCLAPPRSVALEPVRARNTTHTTVR